MFKNMFQKALKIKKGRQWSIPDKKGRQRCFRPNRCLLNSIIFNIDPTNVPDS